jgi:hypothetical protein
MPCNSGDGKLPNLFFTVYRPFGVGESRGEAKVIKGLRECTPLRDKERQMVQEILSRSVCASADRTSRVEGNCLRFKEEVRSMEWSGDGMKVHRRNTPDFFPYM